MGQPLINNPQEILWDRKCSCKLIRHKLISVFKSSVHTLDCNDFFHYGHSLSPKEAREG